MRSFSTELCDFIGGFCPREGLQWTGDTGATLSPVAPFASYYGADLRQVLQRCPSALKAPSPSGKLRSKLSCHVPNPLKPTALQVRIPIEKAPAAANLRHQRIATEGEGGFEALSARDGCHRFHRPTFRSRLPSTRERRGRRADNCPLGGRPRRWPIRLQGSRSSCQLRRHFFFATRHAPGALRVLLAAAPGVPSGASPKAYYLQRLY